MLHEHAACLRDAQLTYRHNPPVPQTEGCVAQLETQETKHSEELRAEGTEKNDDHQSTRLKRKKCNHYFSELSSKSQSCWQLRNTHKDVKEG